MYIDNYKYIGSFFLRQISTYLPQLSIFENTRITLDFHSFSPLAHQAPEMPCMHSITHTVLLRWLKLKQNITTGTLPACWWQRARKRSGPLFGMHVASQPPQKNWP